MYDPQAATDIMRAKLNERLRCFIYKTKEVILLFNSLANKFSFVELFVNGLVFPLNI